MAAMSIGTTTLSLRVRLINGVYRGHLPDKGPELFPQPARLHAALLNAAGRGTLAERGKDGVLRPSETSLHALRWLENNPPVGIEIPAHQWVHRGGRRFIYREVSSVNRAHRTEERAVSDGVAVASHFGFTWNDVPEDVAATLVELTADIGYLGEAESVAVVEPGDVCPTLVLDASSSPFEHGGLGFECAQPGRTDHLVEGFAAVAARKAQKKERYKKAELPLPSPSPRAFIARCRYSAPRPAPVDGPWTSVVLLGLPGEDIPVDFRVELAKVTHRAIVSAIGFGASPMITGRYPKTVVARPANHLAIHYLPRFEARRFGYDHGVIALLIPDGADGADLEQLATVLPLVAANGIWSRRLGRREVSFDGQTVAADEFWPPEEEGMKRLWLTATPVVPDSRPVDSRRFGRTWTLRDAGLLSIAFTWRAGLDFRGRHDTLYINGRNAAYERGARVIRARTVDTRPREFAHTVPQSVTIQAWRGVVDLGHIGADTAIAAIGQSRHMGGGLLVPHDVPREEYRMLVEGSSDE
ncbi:type I-U CRISPR-associated protein Csb2 [Corynebacterium sp. LK2510]|uniref:type I-G CRISPR-associated protein Csb2 n=1 Tax=Corynebacterium sp. LK2510 TaxID=3110472 RepID=UPI0034CDA11F